MHGASVTHMPNSLKQLQTAPVTSLLKEKKGRRRREGEGKKERKCFNQVVNIKYVPSIATAKLPNVWDADMNLHKRLLGH